MVKKKAVKKPVKKAKKPLKKPANKAVKKVAKAPLKKALKKAKKAVKVGDSPKSRKLTKKTGVPRAPRGIFNNLVAQIGGEDAIRITEFIKDKRHTSEFIIAEKTDIEIHRTRMLLYRLLENNLATFKRKKDKQKGWYICYWDLTPKNANHTMLKMKEAKLEKLLDRLAQEKDNQYYMCKNTCIRMNFESSVDFEFKCPECGELMNMQDNQRTIEFLEQSIKELTKEIASAS